MILYRILLGIAALAFGVVVYFFLLGLADGSVSAFNGGIWALLLAGTAAVTFGGWALGRAGRTGLAKAVLALLAVPAGLCGLFILTLLLTNPRWN